MNLKELIEKWSEKANLLSQAYNGIISSDNVIQSDAIWQVISDLRHVSPDDDSNSHNITRLQLAAIRGNIQECLLKISHSGSHYQMSTMVGNSLFDLDKTLRRTLEMLPKPAPIVIDEKQLELIKQQAERGDMKASQAEYNACIPGNNSTAHKCVPGDNSTVCTICGK